MKPVIKFETPADEESAPARELVCTVWPVVGTGAESSLDDPVISSRTIMIAGGPDDDSQLELPIAGTYLIDIGFPSGRHTRRTISVESGRSYRFLVQDKRYAVKVPSSSKSALGGFPRVLAAADNKVKGEPDLEVRVVQTPQQVGLNTLRDFVSHVTSNSQEGEPIQRTFSAGTFETKLLPPNQGIFAEHGYARSWLVVSGTGNHSTLIAYPREWLSKDSRESFRLVSRRKSKTGAEATKWTVSLELLEPSYGALIEHLTRRDVQSSEVISSSMRAQATNALYEKQENPVSAAAGAYLFAMGSLDRGDKRDWMFNLYRRFQWLPDAAIALGWRLLREGNRESYEWTQARLMLVEACMRGLPYYTVGLHILVDALNALCMSDPDDAQLKQYLAVVTAADISCVRSEPFTTLQTSRFLGMPRE